VGSVIYRILVTGSRDWPHPEVVYRELAKAASATTLPIVVVEGACHLGGADQTAWNWAEDEAWRGNDVTSERHPADWGKYGKAAGFIRNQEMVNLGADICLAFCLNDSKGTMHCATAAKAAGIPVRVIKLNVEEWAA
jgi:hypothetical protein